VVIEAGTVYISADRVRDWAEQLTMNQILQRDRATLRITEDF